MTKIERLFFKLCILGLMLINLLSLINFAIYCNFEETPINIFLGVISNLVMILLLKWLSEYNSVLDEPIQIDNKETDKK